MAYHCWPNGNHYVCHTVGIRSIVVKMFDGMVGDLADVRYVSGSQKIGSLRCFGGERLVLENNGLRISCGALVNAKEI